MRTRFVSAGLRPIGCFALLAFLAACLHGCAVVAVADAVVTVGAAAVSVTATVVETTVDVAAVGVGSVVGDDEDSD